MPPNPAIAGWKVLSQQETFGTDPMGRAVEGVKIFFQTGGGHNGSVFIPKDRYNVENAKAAILDAAGLLDGVGKLSG
jgi:hypothetical protein